MKARKGGSQVVIPTATCSEVVSKCRSFDVNSQPDSGSDQCASDVIAQGLTTGGRIAMLVGLSFGAAATLYAATWLELWLRKALAMQYLAGAMVGPLALSCAVAVWLMPVVKFPKFRDVGSFTLPKTWTVLLLVPLPSVYLLYFEQPQPGFHWAIHVWDCMATGAFEELIFRGYAFRCRPQTRPRIVVFASALCFALIHLINLSHSSFDSVILQVLATFGLGLAFGIVRLVSGSLAWCILMHGIFNATSEFAKAEGSYNIVFPLTLVGCFVGWLLMFCLNPKMRGHAR